MIKSEHACRFGTLPGLPPPQHGVAIISHTSAYASLSNHTGLSQPPADHGDAHVLSEGDRSEERIRLHPVQAGVKLGGEDHLEKETSRAHHLQVWQQQLCRSGNHGCRTVFTQARPIYNVKLFWSTKSNVQSTFSPQVSLTFQVF